MIPLRLTLKNFLCYGDAVPTLDLEDLHLVCLCGQNGHGKSALLDAITWALWGKARGRSQDELIHHGHDEMLVELEFLARGARHRVIRRHALTLGRGSRGASDLQFQVYTGSEFHPITGNSIRETQSKIDQLTGMDYETFINSAFLLQGRADEFTNKTPDKRKEVLAKVLGLDFYDSLQDRAKELADEKRDASSKVEGQLQHIRQEVSRRDSLHAEVEAVNRDLEGAQASLEASATEVNATRIRVEDLRRKLGELEEIKRRIPGIEKEISHLGEEIGSREGRILAYGALIGEKTSIEAGLAELRQIRQRFEDMNHSQESFDHLNQLKTELESKVHGARARLEEQVGQMERLVGMELRPKVEALSNIESDLEDARARLGELEKAEEDLARQRTDLNNLSSWVGQLEAVADQLKAEGQDLRSKVDLVGSADHGARCPLCGTELGADGCLRLSDSYDAQIKEKRRLYQENQATLSSAQEKKVELEKVLPQHEASFGTRQHDAPTKVALLEGQLEESHRAAEDMKRTSLEVEDGKRLLEEGKLLPQEQEQIVALEVQIKESGYDRDTHRGLYEQMQQVQPFEDRHRRLVEAEDGLPGERESLTRAQDLYGRRQEELATSRDRQREIDSEVSELPRWEDRRSRAESAHRELEARRQDLFRRQVALEGELVRLEALEREIDKKEKGLKALRDEQEVYRELTQAFGRRGVQAILIETVLPSLEEEANRLLCRMTDGRMKVKLETQRERKGRRGEPLETLEIFISDEVGRRSYEMFSGGEAFRVNLALRIALSKVLAHRSGAPLPTLFIDEGFGTQDAAGRERILDVIRAIEEDFEKIIVITHLDELKEAFPARIEVQKDGAGSTFSVSY